jgi:hypothetical protein
MKMKNNERITNELMSRVFSDIGEKQIENLLLESKPLMTHKEIAEHVEKHLDNYLNVDEQKQLVIEVQGRSINDEIDYLGLRVAIQLTSVYLEEAIKKIITQKSFVGNNQFDPIKNPRMFMLSKFFEEEHGVKIRVIDKIEGL